MKRLSLSMVLVMALSPTLASSQVRELPSPAGPGSGQPNLAVAPDGSVYLSWIERLGEGRFSLRFAEKEGDGWSPPRVIAEGSNWFVNWADFSSLVALPDGSLAAHWLVKSGPGTFDYDVTISRSFDKGTSWGKPFVPHRDGVKAEHGFVSMFAAADGNLAAVWLDGREMKPGANGNDHGHGDMTLRYVKIMRDGSLTDDASLDRRVCECCQTSAAMTAVGPIIVFRDRSEEEKEIRDISIVRLNAGKWSVPRPVFQDGWQLNGCPVNGPAVAASGKRVAVAWFTAANNSARVKMAFSSDAGESFGRSDSGGRRQPRWPRRRAVARRWRFDGVLAREGGWRRRAPRTPIQFLRAGFPRHYYFSSRRCALQWFPTDGALAENSDLRLDRSARVHRHHDSSLTGHLKRSMRTKVWYSA
ncbi:MAG: hypothetical protein ABIO94_13325 [Opitutaceae bacterium]